MSESVSEIIDRLESIAAYDGSWRTITKEIPLLNDRVSELREREARLDDVLVIALVGGSGVGKSTLLNALAGDELAKTSEYRPCTSIPTVYHPPGITFSFNQWNMVAGSALENLVIIDTPDSDTVVREHRDHVIEALSQCDVIAICADAEKYLDEATWSLLRPLQSERSMICIETKSTDRGTVRNHWVSRLEEQGFSIAEYFRVNALHTFDRKLAARPPGDNEFDFVRLEAFLRDELTTDRIRRIKRSNVAGLLSKTVGRLEENLLPHRTELETLSLAIGEHDAELMDECFEAVAKRLFAEPHLWMFALGRETSLRAKGIVGNLLRLLETIRTLPARLSGWSLLGMKGGPGRRAASLLTDKSLVEEADVTPIHQIKHLFENAQSEVNLHMTKGGFSVHPPEDAYAKFVDALNNRIGAVLSGPARDSIVNKARVITSWPVTIVSDAPVIAFVGFSAFNIVESYFGTELLTGSFFLHAFLVLAIIAGAELFILSLVARWLAWAARQSALRALQDAMSKGLLAFRENQREVDKTLHLLEEVEAVRDAVRS